MNPSEAFDHFYQGHHRRLYRLLEMGMTNQGDIDDTFQHVCLHIYRAFCRNAPITHLKNYVNMAADNAVRTLMNKKQNLPRQYDLEQLEVLVDSSDAFEACDEQEESEALLQHLWNCVDTLHPQHREALVLYYREGLSYSTIIERLGINKDTLKSRLLRARKDLRKKIKISLLDKNSVDHAVLSRA